jgi:molybdopterin molybdotransferase
MITPDSAWGIVRRHTKSLPAIYLSLNKAHGLCLAETVCADRDMPPADRSAMDGYAVRASDIAHCPATLRLVGEVAAGSSAQPRVARDTCVRILTGANVPPGADTVVMIEDTQESGGIVTVMTSVKAGSNILRHGEDARRKDLLLTKGTMINSAQAGVCASVGKARVRVTDKPAVTVICVGQELREPGSRVRSHEIRNSNGPALCAALQEWGCGIITYLTLPDDLRSLTSEIRRALKRCDVLILAGGMSVGKYDFVRAAIESAGAAVRFHGVAMKPGKPTLYATASGNKHIFGLPGNPLSALTAFHEFALPCIRRMSGLAIKDCRPSFMLPLTSDMNSKGGRIRYVQGKIVWKKTGPQVDIVESQSSADLVSAGKADGTIVVSADATHLSAGSFIQFRPWRRIP